MKKPTVAIFIIIILSIVIFWAYSSFNFLSINESLSKIVSEVNELNEININKMNQDFKLKMQSKDQLINLGYKILDNGDESCFVHYSINNTLSFMIHGHKWRFIDDNNQGLSCCCDNKYMSLDSSCLCDFIG